MDALLIALLALIALLCLALWRLKTRLNELSNETQLARQELEQQLTLVKRLYVISENISEGIIFVDASQQMLYLNRAAKMLLNINNGIGSDLGKLIWNWEIQPLVKAVLAQQADFLSQIVVDNDRTFQVSVRAGGTALPGGAVILIDEITELHRLGRIRRDFIANISHELRTPVATLQLLAETLPNALSENPAVISELVSKLRGQIDLLHQLTDEAMDLALIESGQMPLKLVECSISQIANDALELLRPQAERKQLSLHVQVPMDLFVLADSAGIQKVLSNLLHNAIKFTPSQGQIHLRARRDGDNIEIAVADNGIGIPARDLSRVFERFYKADRARAEGASRGTGLGLAIAKHIVEGHGGRIWVESIEGKGSTFYFTLPSAH